MIWELFILYIMGIYFIYSVQKTSLKEDKEFLNSIIPTQILQKIVLQLLNMIIDIAVISIYTAIWD